MKKTTRLLCATMFALAFFSQVAHAAKLALVVGNDKYQNVPELKNAVADAKAMSAALEQAGYNVGLA